MIYAITLILLVLSAAFQGAPAAVPCDPALAALFAPARPVWGRYEVCADAGPARDDGWHWAQPEHLEALDAFGAAGTYDRSKLVQLYGGLRVTVQRGWRADASRFESATRLSPYPDSSLNRLHEGTLLIRWIIERR